MLKRLSCAWLVFCSIFTPILSFAAEKPLAFFVGHSQWQKGSKGPGLPAEWDYCSAVGAQVVQLAPQYHINAKVFLRGQGDYKAAVEKMHQEKNQWAPDAPVISCHYNSTPITVENTQLHAPKLRKLFANGQTPRKGSLMGTMVLYKPNPQSKKIAAQLLKNVEDIMPRQDSRFINISDIVPIDTQDRGAREILSQDKAPVVLLEIGYGDNAVNMATMASPDFQKKLAEAILKTFENN